VIDPSVTLDVYLEIIRRHHWSIRHVIETHVHADHLSRARELVPQTGAALRLPPQDRVRFAFTTSADGEQIRLGSATLRARHTPGHTNESTCYVLNDAAVFTGDTLFTNGCFHTSMRVLTLDGLVCGIVPRTIGGPYAVLVAEQLRAAGARVIVGITSAGRVSPSLPLPSIVVVDEAVRDEGTSLHYLPPAPSVATPSPHLVDVMAQKLSAFHVPVSRGPVWTTDAPLRMMLAFTLAARPFKWVTDVTAQAPPAQGSQPRGQTPSNMQDMMKMHEQIMAEMKAADGPLDALLKDMNAATGDAKVNAVAAVVTELVRLQRSKSTARSRPLNHLTPC
jgi:hypothetical protein